MNSSDVPASPVTYLTQCDDHSLENYFQGRLKPGNSAGGILALVAENNHSDIPHLQAIARQHQQHLIGVVAPSLITKQGFVDCGIILLDLPETSQYALLQLPEDAKGGALEASITTLIEQTGIATCYEGDTLYLFFDGLVPYIASYIDALYMRLADRIQYVGTNVGSGSFKPITCLFDQEWMIQHGVLAFLRQQDMPLSLVHGYCMPPETHYATATSGNKIQHIDWRPAFEVYCELVKDRYGIEITRENFYQHAVHMPFGIVRLDGNPIVRIPVAIDDDGAIYCVGEVPENTILTLLDAPQPGSAATVDEIMGNLASKNIASCLLMYCAGRRMHMGETADTELTTLIERMPDIEVFGLLSLGEIGESIKQTYPALHNGAIVCSPWAHR